MSERCDFSTAIDGVTIRMCPKPAVARVRGVFPWGVAACEEHLPLAKERQKSAGSPLSHT